ncbi:MAG: CDP-alcohol phosphatidyltransferase family protein [Candidatus Binatia bacterium]
MRRQVANLVSLLRLVLTLPFLDAVGRAAHGASGWPAAGYFAAIALSDFVDGRIARRFGAASRGGRVLDHGADIVFLLSALGLYAALGLAPWWVPAAVAASFGVYVVDSARRSGGRPTLIGSRLGHLGGVGNYVVVGVLVGNETVGLHWLPPVVLSALFALVPLYSGASILSRLAAGGAARTPAAPPRG